MINKTENYSGLAHLTDSYGNKLSLADLSDFADRKKEVAKSSHTKPKPNLPEKYNGKSWDDLYQSDELETIRNTYPDHYEKLRIEKFKLVNKLK